MQAHPSVRLLTTQEAAQYLNLSHSFLSKARLRGDGPRFRKFGRSVRYTTDDLLDYMRKCSRTSTAEA